METTQSIRLRGEYLKERNAYIVGNEPAIFHCHHYNCYLQAVILDTVDYLPSIESIMIDRAHEISYTQFSNFFQKYQISSELERKLIVEDYYRFAGFGKVGFANITSTGGKVETDSEHYGIGWRSKFHKSNTPVSYFTTGFLSGAAEAIFNLKLGSLKGQQISCLSMGSDVSKFKISPAQSRRNLSLSQKEGKFQDVYAQETSNKVDYLAIKEALTNMPIEGDMQNGLINAFGVLLTRHYANYYTNISYDFLNLFLDKMGDYGRSTAVDLLTEAGHVCAFNTFGGIMQSNEWNAMIKPMLSTKEDWVHGMTAVVNALGWGVWEIKELVPNKKLVMKIQSGYESNAYLKKYSQSNFPISFLATGGTAGLMNLVYTLSLPEKTPVTLDENLYRQISISTSRFTAKQLKCRAMGDSYDLIEASVK